jgi:hypothetical protein
MNRHFSLRRLLDAPIRSAQARRAERLGRPVRRDEGVTMVELLVSIVITGTIIGSIALAFSVILSTNSPALARISESKDVTFVQTYLPLDLASAVAPTTAEASAGMKAINDEASYMPVPGLPGTNAVTVRRVDVSTGEKYWVSYRYVQDGAEWVLLRYEIRGANTTVRTVATELAAPPEGWVAGVDKPTHAIELNARNQVVLRPVGDDITISFDSGNDFTTGGAALSKGLSLQTNNFGGFTQTKAPPTKCGGDIALIIDSSGSVPANNSGTVNGGKATERAARDFIEAFSGTPTRLGIYGFDRAAYRMYPNAAGSLVSMLDPTSSQIPAAVARVEQLDDYGKQSDFPARSWNQSSPDPNGDGVHWDQINSGTNWEDGIRLPFFANPDGTGQLPTTPSLVVLVTDGNPTYVNSGATQASVSGSAATTATANMAKKAKATGARIVGVLVGDANSANMSQVVGNTAYSPAQNNASSADYFAGTFDGLGELLRQIAVSECGGTVTIQKRIDTGSGLSTPSSGVWNYTASSGTSVLDRSKVASVTYDYNVPGNGTTTDTIYEQVGGDYVFDRYECYSRGVLLAPPAVGPAIDAETGAVVPGVQVTLGPDQAVSCLMISRPK